LKQEAVATYKIEGEYLELTAETPPSSWDPNSLMFTQLESRLVDQYGELVEQPVGHPRQLFMLTTDERLHDPFRRLRISAADISHLCEFSWYEWVMYNDKAGYPEDTEKILKARPILRPN
jgi:hypothetical protein